MNLLYVFEQGNFVLTATFLILIFMSVVSWYVICWKSWQLKKEKANLAAFKKTYVLSKDWPLHMKITSQNGAVSLLIKEYESLNPLLDLYNEPQRKAILAMHFSQTLDSIKIWTDKGLTILASIGSLAPFVGLFGTVWGIYGALIKIAGQGNASLNVVAGPMGEALIATAAGLFAAIPAVLAYNALVRSNRILIQDYRHIAEHLATYLAMPQKDARKNPEPLKLVTGA